MYLFTFSFEETLSPKSSKFRRKKRVLGLPTVKVSWF